MNRLQRITLVLFIVVVINWILNRLTGYQILGGDLLNFLFVLFLIILILRSTRSIFRILLWRLRNRLLVSYFLFGVVPLVLIGAMLLLAFELLFGQVAANTIRAEVNNRVDAISGVAHDLALNTLYGSNTAEFVQDLRQRVPKLSVIVRSGGVSTAFPSDARIQEIPEWSEAGAKDLMKFEDDVVIMTAHAREHAGDRTVDVLAFAPLDSELLSEIAPNLGTASFIQGTIRSEGGGAALSSEGLPDKDPNVLPTTLAQASRQLPAARGFWDIRLGWASLWELKRPNGETEEAVMAGTTRPSLIIPSFFSTLGSVAGIIGYVLLAVAIVFIFVEAVSLILSLSLTRTITRSVHDLYTGTQHVATGDFTHRIPVRSKDQLSELAGSFNTMTERIRNLIVEVKEKEKLESELEIAREVQTQLFPKGSPHMKTMELVGVCNPARVVSGDYYDFVPAGPDRMAIVIGDISGKGISAALLMASVQSSLHAQLTAMNGTDASTATLVTRLNHQLYENTPPEKYATFYCALYNDDTGRLAYTNAGHLPPILVRDGNASRLEVNGTVVGLLPNAVYEQLVIDLKPGDMLAAFTDGITESENAAGEQFGEQRLTAMLVENAHRPLDEIVKAVLAAIHGWAYDLDNQDDTTMLLARRV
jgi:phosphoserine phosphatase RsbU/P